LRGGRDQQRERDRAGAIERAAMRDEGSRCCEDCEDSYRGSGFTTPEEKIRGTHESRSGCERDVLTRETLMLRERRRCRCHRRSVASDDEDNLKGT
jgi:hypothetical protein